jgi:cytochrome P450 PksS
VKDRLSKDFTSMMPWLPAFVRPVTHHMLNRDPPDHTRLRSLVSKAFTARRIEQLRGRVQVVCDELLTGASSRGSFDLLHHYALPLPLNVIADLLGIRKEDRHRFHTLTRGSLPLGAPTGGLLDILLALPYAWLLIRYFRELFDERRARPRDDLITALVQAEEQGDHLSEEELLAMGVLLLLAGYETTVNLIASGTLALLVNPEQRERLSNDPDLAEPAVEELLRYTSPIEISTPRLAREDIAIGPLTIARGEMVAVVLGSANHDETRFPDPGTLDIARDPNRHVAFGGDIHFCLGASLARMEARIAFTTLLRRLPGLRLAKPPESLRWRRNLPLRALAELPVATR